MLSRGTYRLLFVLSLLSFIDIYIAQQSDDPEILEAPSSLLVPINTQAVFVCKVHCVRECTLQWFIGNSSTRNQHQKDYYEARGFTFSSYHDLYNVTLRLTVNATLSNNNTILRCHALLNSRGATSVTSDTAILQIVSESPVVPNPVVIIQSPTSLLLKWSPPFLWPGYHIDYFIVSTKNKTDGHLITADTITINASFDDMILALNKNFSDEYVQDCNEFTFSISAFSDYHWARPQMFNITRGFPSDITELPVLSVNISVYFTYNTVPNVRIKVELPSSVCSYQELNYTITIENISDNHTLIYGPYHHQGPGSIKQDIARGLRKDQDYSASITFRSHFYEYISYNHTFDTNFYAVLQNSCKDSSITGYKVAIGVCVGVILLLALVLATVICICGYSSWRSQVKHFNNKRPMNYTDPVYETILNQQKPEVFTEWRLSPATASGDQQEKDIPDADWKREHPRLEIDGT